MALSKPTKGFLIAGGVAGGAAILSYPAFLGGSLAAGGTVAGGVGATLSFLSFIMPVVFGGLAVLFFTLGLIAYGVSKRHAAKDVEAEPLLGSNSNLPSVNELVESFTERTGLTRSQERRAAAGEPVVTHVTGPEHSGAGLTASG